MSEIFQNRKASEWLPTTKKEMEARGWDSLDVILFSGDAYVDHPSFGTAVIGRLIESEGFKIAIVPQPNWQDDLRDFKKLGTPNLFFGISAGCMDSMVNHYTANKRKRSDDAYTPDGKPGFRPDYTVITYSKILKKLFPNVPILIGGVEASLRRFSHYDYWSDSLKPSILEESGADLLIYGMGELPIKMLLDILKSGKSFSECRDIPQTAFISEKKPVISEKTIFLASHKACLGSKKVFARNFRIIEEASNQIDAPFLVQAYSNGFLQVNPPFQPMDEKEVDAAFDLPYTRLPHPKYAKRGDIPAYIMIRHSINMHRGCFGGCSFCTISAHQGKHIASRSEKSILREVEQVSKMSDFKGYISDLGGPSANMYKMSGINIDICKPCKRPSCIYPNVCKNLNSSHLPLIDIYNKAKKVDGIKKITIGSGVRYDMIIDKPAYEDRKNGYSKYLKQLVIHHVSGRLKVAPEHTSPQVLKVIRKHDFSLFEKLKYRFDKLCKDEGINQQLIPYFISSLPGCHEEDMIDLANKTRKLGYRLEQVQDFTPTPMTLSTVMFYSGVDPYTLKSIYSAKSKQAREVQRNHIFWYKKDNKKEKWQGRSSKKKR